MGLLIVGLAGCASPPKRQTPDIGISAPAAWSSDVTAAAPVEPADIRWWLKFEDNDLNQLVEEALQNNYNLKAAVARVDQAEAITRMSTADLLPNASAGFRAARQRQNWIGIPIPGAGGIITSRSTSFGVSLDVSWEIDLWGRLRKGQSASAAELEAGWADLAALRLSVASQTAKAWFAVIEARLQLELAEETVNNYRTSADFVRDRYQQGTNSSLDLRLALANLAGAEALLEKRKDFVARATRQLEILLGRYPAAKLAAAADLPALPGDIPDGLPSTLLIRRPDLIAAERRFAAAEARVSQARRAFFPRISLTSSGGTLSDQLEDLTSGDFSVWSIAAGITQPIFQGGRLRASLAQSHAVSDMALASYAGALLNAFSEVESAFFAEQILARRETFLLEATHQSEAARRLAELQYTSGLVNYITVLETQRRALISRSEYISARRERLDARVNLHLALGGGFELSKEWTSFLDPAVISKVEAPIE